MGWTPTRYTHNGVVEIAYDQLAGSAGDPLLLVMGLAVSRFWWPAGLGQAFADRGVRGGALRPARRQAVNPDARWPGR